MPSCLKEGGRKRMQGTGERCSALHFCIQLQSNAIQKLSFALQFILNFSTVKVSVILIPEMHLCFPALQCAALRFCISSLIVHFTDVHKNRLLCCTSIHFTAINFAACAMCISSKSFRSDQNDLVKLLWNNRKFE